MVLCLWQLSLDALDTALQALQVCYIAALCIRNNARYLLDWSSLCDGVLFYVPDERINLCVADLQKKKQYRKGTLSGRILIRTKKLSSHLLSWPVRVRVCTLSSEMATTIGFVPAL